MKKYKIINNSLGWLCFIIAAVTYLLTLEPTASFWDCPEFISQGFKLEVGHPPGNPIWMLTARFFVNFAGGDLANVAIAVNAMSALLSAGTILLLFWTITHLVKRLIVKDDATTVSLTQMLVIFGSGLVGSLAYTWSDTFWFSATEGEVYAFSSFCTALVFWLILKWENRADNPLSDRYLILIAYVIGISIAVHLLNLLCIPAIVLVVYYRKFKNTSAKGSLIALGVSCVIVGLILYGLVPGFIEVSQYFELFAVNTLGMSYNSGVLAYAIVTVAVLVWTIYEIYRQKSSRNIKLGVIMSLVVSGIAFIGDNAMIPVLVLAGAIIYFFWFCKKLPVRILNIAVTSILVIFIGYSSYALLLIRSNANTPMNQNAPDNVFALASYLNREQYGDRPLFYGQTYNSGVLYEADPSTGAVKACQTHGSKMYNKVIKTSDDEPDRYVMTGQKVDYEMIPELNMIFPRMYSTNGSHVAAYKSWVGMNSTNTKFVDATIYVDENGQSLYKEKRERPTFGQNFQFFLTYQLNHMYWRYFMWNFAGRQNDIQGNGEVNHGNWISGIPFIDNARLGDQSLLPDDLGEGNKGHNVFYLLPLLLGIIGLLWQAFVSKRGIEQFWVIFFLFFMTGIAIVLYLNQTPGQPRERDYAFAGSFYAYAIWIGFGVAALYNILKDFIAKKAPESKVAAAVACVLGIAVPLQMVSQTWDDHDRSGRYAARDFGMNYLSSLDPNAIIFTNGDNDTFPLWYAQEVEGYRTDVRVVNLSYLTTDWYANQLRYPYYDAPAVDIQATPADYGHDRRQFNYFLTPDTTAVPVSASLRALYSDDAEKNKHGVPEMKYPNMYIPVDPQAAIESGRVAPELAEAIQEYIKINLSEDGKCSSEGGIALNKTLVLDMLSSSVANGWNRPIYFAMTVPDDYYMSLTPYMSCTGLAYEVTPLLEGDEYSAAVNTDKMYDNVMNKFRWGGLDKVESPADIYLDETVRRMVTTHRSALLDLATALYNEGVRAEAVAEEYGDTTAVEVKDLKEFAGQRYQMALNVMDTMMENLPVEACPYSIQIGANIADLYLRLSLPLGDDTLREKAIEILDSEIRRYAQYMIYFQSLKPYEFATLQRNDRYIQSAYFTTLLQMYSNADADVEALMEELSVQGVNFHKILEQLKN